VTVQFSIAEAAEFIRTTLANQTNGRLSYSTLTVEIIPDAIAPGHNPDKLTNAQVGVADGWRLSQSDEISDEPEDYEETQWWETDHWSFTGPWSALSGRCTLRTKNPPDFYKA